MATLEDLTEHEAKEIDAAIEVELVASGYDPGFYLAKDEGGPKSLLCLARAEETAKAIDAAELCSAWPRPSDTTGRLISASEPLEANVPARLAAGTSPIMQLSSRDVAGDAAPSGGPPATAEEITG